MLVVLTFPLVTTLVTRAQIERSGVDVTATVVQTTKNGDAYLVAFRLPEEIDPDQDTYSAEVDQATYEKVGASKEIGVRVLEDRPEAHRVEGEIRSKAPYVTVAVADALVLGVGLWWVRHGRRRPTVLIRANSPLYRPTPTSPARSRVSPTTPTRPSARSCRPISTPRSSSTSASAGWSSRWPGTRTPFPSVPPPAPAVPSSAHPSVAGSARLRQRDGAASGTRLGHTTQAPYLLVTDEPGQGGGMSATASSYSITMRLHTAPDHGVVGRVATAIAREGGIVTAIDVADSSHDRLVVDAHGAAPRTRRIPRSCRRVRARDRGRRGPQGQRQRRPLLHLGGKIEVTSKVPLRTRDDLSMAYTPGVGRVSMALAEHPEDISRLTIKGNTVAVVTDGSAVLGLGDIGPRAALPVMEGKAVLFKRVAKIDALPICLASQDTDEIVQAVELISPSFGGINLEDIAAPRCFEIEARLRASLDIPVFHDDQHGTAIVVMAALTNALRVVDKKIADVRVVVAGAGAAGTAIVTLMLAAGISDIVVWDREGLLSSDDPDLPLSKASLAARTNPRKVRGDLHDGLRGADVFVGVSAPNVLDPLWIKDMAPDAVVFALANPDPEVDPAEADKYAAVVASGRSDYPNQINNVLAFPGVFRGLLDARAKEITLDMLLRAADAIAHVVSDEEINPNFIIPSVFNPAVPKAVAAAIRGRSTERVADSTA